MWGNAYESARELMSRAHRTGDPRVVEKAVRQLQGVLEAAPADDPLRGKYLADLGVAFRWRFEHTGDPADIAAALQAGADAVRATPVFDLDRYDHLNGLVNAMWTRFSWSGRQEHLDEGIQVAQEAAAATPDDHPARPMILSGLGSALRARYGRNGLLSDLDAAIRAGARAVDACPDEPEILSDLLTTLQAGPRLRDGDFDGAIRALTWAVYSTPRDHPQQVENLYMLAEGLERRHTRTGSPDDLDDLIRVAGRAVALSPRLPWLAGLGGWLTLRYQRTGALPDLDEAVRVSSEVAKLTDPNDTEHAVTLTNLGTVLRLRFERTDAMADLDEAIRFTAAALRATGANSPDRAVLLSNLAITLVLRHGRTQAMVDLDEAVRLHSEAAQTIALSAVQRPGVLAAFAHALELRFLRTAKEADLDEAVRVGTEAASRAPRDDPSRPMILANLASTLLVRHGHAGDAADMDQAVLVAADAVALTPPDHPQRAKRLFVHGYTLAYRFFRTEQHVDAQQAARAFLDAHRADVVTPSVRTRAAKQLGELHASLGNWPVAVESFAVAVRWLPVVASREEARDAQEHRLGTLEGLASDAAACALAGGDAEQAVEMLEAGRGVLLAQALETRTDVTELRAEAPELAARFESVRHRLDHATVAERALVAEFDELVAGIRRRPGFGRFLSPEPVAELQREAAEGPIVSLNISDFRCDALILTPYGVRALALPGLTKEIAWDRAERFLAALAVCHGHTTTLVERLRAQQSIVDQLAWLWDAVTEPVLAALGHTGPPAPGQPWPRIWWSPSGPLTFFPLHAAGYHDDPRPGRTVLDRVVSSYTPTVRVLRHHRRRRAAHQAPTALVVAMPHTPGAAELPGAQREHDLLTRVFNGATTVVGSAATCRRVLAELPRHTVAHFACHGIGDMTEPSRSRVLLHDHVDNPLTIPEIARLDLNAELAYLSACETARTGTRLADEAIHLASAFQLAGYANVIATLWTIADESAVTIAGDFYAHFGSSRNAALALHETIRRARDAHPGTPSTWAAHIHSGI